MTSVFRSATGEVEETLIVDVNLYQLHNRDKTKSFSILGDQITPEKLRRLADRLELSLRCSRESSNK